MNKFQIWLTKEGYQRDEWGVWKLDDGSIMSGELLSKKLTEYKKLQNESI